MAHKTLVGGTAYDISGGKTLIGGTSYGISGGKTLVGGTGYTISLAVQEYTIAVYGGYSNTLRDDGLHAVLILPDGTVVKSGTYTVREGETVTVEMRCGTKKILGEFYNVACIVKPEGGTSTRYDCSAALSNTQSIDFTITGNMTFTFSYEVEEE